VLAFLTLPEESPVFPQEVFVVQWRVARQGAAGLIAGYVTTRASWRVGITGKANIGLATSA